MKIVTSGEMREQRKQAQPKPKKPRLVSHGSLISLACDHYTTTQVQEIYSAFCSSPDLYMCEICGIEVAGKPVKERAPQPEEPPF